MDSRRLHLSCLTLRMHPGFRRLFSERSKLDIQKEANETGSALHYQVSFIPRKHELIWISDLIGTALPVATHSRAI
jgi:hypothetical protein